MTLMEKHMGGAISQCPPKQTPNSFGIFFGNCKHFHGQRYSEMEEVSGSIPQALFAPKGRNLPRKVKTPSQEEVLRNGGTRSMPQALRQKAELTP